MKRAWFEISWGPEPFEALFDPNAVSPNNPSPALLPLPVTPVEAFIPVEPEGALSDMSSPSSDQHRCESIEADPITDWDPITTHHLARALKVEPAFVPCETFAYSVNCKAQRQQTHCQIPDRRTLAPLSQVTTL